MSEKWIDRAWRDVLTENIDDAILFFKPDIAADRDYSKKPDLFSTELPAIGGDSDKGLRHPDMCLSIPMKIGIAQRLAFHVEQEHWDDKELALRMFQGYYRMSDKFQVPVASLAIITGDLKPINSYVSSCYGTEVNFKYNVYHVANADISALERDERVFALVVLAARRMLDSSGNPVKRGQYSLELLNLMQERGYNAETAKSLQMFIYHILRLKDKEIDPQIKEVWKMRLIPIDEAIREIRIRNAKEEGMEEGMEKGMEKGREEGREKERLEVAREMLIEGDSFEKIARVTKWPLETLKEKLSIQTGISYH